MHVITYTTTAPAMNQYAIAGTSVLVCQHSRCDMKQKLNGPRRKIYDFCIKFFHAIFVLGIKHDYSYNIYIHI